MQVFIGKENLIGKVPVGAKVCIRVAFSDPAAQAARLLQLRVGTIF
jgi:hypothetical protein